MDLSNYDKEYVILTSDRLIFNAKDDSIINSTNKFFLVSSNEGIHFNIGNDKNNNSKFIVNSPKIELGLSSKGSLQPIAKGNETVDIIKRILKALNSFSTKMQGAVGIGAGTVDLPIVRSASLVLSNDVNLIIKDIEKIKSKVTFSI